VITLARPKQPNALRPALIDVACVATLAEGMQVLVEEFALAQCRAARQWFRSWVEARAQEAPWLDQLALKEDRASAAPTAPS